MRPGVTRWHDSTGIVFPPVCIGHALSCSRTRLVVIGHEEAYSTAGTASPQSYQALGNTP